MATSKKPIALVLETGVTWVTDLESVLREVGYRPFRLGKMAQAVSLLRSASRVLVVCGGRLSAADEIVLKGIRAALPAVILVMISETSSTASLQGALENGFTAVLPWPVDSETIVRALGIATATGLPAVARPEIPEEGLTNGRGPGLRPHTKPRG